MKVFLAKNYKLIGKVEESENKQKFWKNFKNNFENKNMYLGAFIYDVRFLGRLVGQALSDFTK